MIIYNMLAEESYLNFPDLYFDILHIAENYRCPNRFSYLQRKQKF